MPPRATHRTLAAALAATSLFALTALSPARAEADPLSGQQWTYGAADPIGAREAWKRSQGQGVVVAVVDSGVQLDHPDLSSGLWTNPSETVNGRDDDGNGYVDDIHGANTMSGDGAVRDTDGHGTSVAGIVAARAGNGTGGSGLAPRAQIMPVKVWSGGARSMLAMSRGIRYAIDNGAKIVNVSMSGDGSIPALDEVVAYAALRGVTIVAAAGNADANTDVTPEFPAALPSPAILSVAATAENGRLQDASNHGTRSVDLAAPGDMIMTTAMGSDHELQAGTSMAAPFVAGALALLQAARPDQSQAQLRGVLLASARRTPGTRGKVATGLLDVGTAMHRVVPGTWGGKAGRAKVRASAGARGGGRLQLRTGRARAGRKVTMRWRAKGAAAVKRWTVKLDGRKVRTGRSAKIRRASAKVSRAGRHRFTVTGFDASGAKVVMAARTFTARR